MNSFHMKTDAVEELLTRVGDREIDAVNHLDAAESLDHAPQFDASHQAPPVRDWNSAASSACKASRVRAPVFGWRCPNS